MLVSFDQMPASSRVWIYQADRSLQEEEVTHIEAHLRTFLEQWAAHGKPLKASVSIAHNQFLVLALDEAFNQATGCSIDASVHCVQELEQKLSVSFSDRTKVAFIREGEIFLMPLQAIKQKVEAGEITPQTVTFNNLVSSKMEWESKWTVPASETWLSRYFK